MEAYRHACKAWINECDGLAIHACQLLRGQRRVPPCRRYRTSILGVRRILHCNHSVPFMRFALLGPLH